MSLVRSFHCLTFVLGLSWIGMSICKGDLITLYDGTGLPSNQAWLSYNSLGGASSQVPIAGGVQLQTDLANQSGYSNYTLLASLKNSAFPSLSRINGFELSFSMRMTSENHTSNDRAGFSMIALASDSRGIELGFWGNEIWAQSSTPLFQHAEGVTIDTSVERSYRLQILGDTYTLRDANSTLLSGAIRDYTAFNGTPGGIPYTLSNYVFLGDNTTSAAAVISLGTITLNSNLSAVPESSSGMYMAWALLLGFVALWAKSRQPKPIQFTLKNSRYDYGTDYNRNADRFQRLHVVSMVRASQGVGR